MLGLASLPADSWWGFNGGKPRFPQFGIPVALIPARAAGGSFLLKSLWFRCRDGLAAFTGMDADVQRVSANVLDLHPLLRWDGYSVVADSGPDLAVELDPAGRVKRGDRLRDPADEGFRANER